MDGCLFVCERRQTVIWPELKRIGCKGSTVLILTGCFVSKASKGIPMQIITDSLTIIFFPELLKLFSMCITVNE